MLDDYKRNKPPRVYSVEFWRFAFTAIVALYHLEIYYQKKLMPSGTTAVEFFFILAGFTIAMSAERRIEKDGMRELSAREAHALALEYIKKKLIAIYPLLAITLILVVVAIPLAFPATQMFTAPIRGGIWEQLQGRFNAIVNTEWEWLMLAGTPMGINEATTSSAPLVPLWFLTQLLIAGYLYTFLINRKYDLMMFAAPLIAVLGYSYFAMNSEKILDFYLKMGLLNAGNVRALAGMAAGISIYRVYVFIKGREWSLFGIIMFQLLELYAIYRFISLMLGAEIGIDNLRRIPYILVIVLLSFSNLTYLSKLLNREFMGKLGKISLPMYLIHFPVATVYWSALYAIKLRPNARALPAFLLNSGGMSSRYQQIPLSWGDVLMYLPLVIIVSLLMHISVIGIRRLMKTISRYRPS